MKKLIILLFLVSAFGSLQAQDVIIKNNGDSIYCKVKEVGIDNIKYVQPNLSSETIFYISKAIVHSIYFENNSFIIISYDKNDGSTKRQATNIPTGPIEYNKTDKKMSIKINTLAMVTGSFELSLERSIKRGISFDIGGAYVFSSADYLVTGAQMNQTYGYYLRGGIKFIKSSDKYLHQQSQPHILQGFFVKPEIIYSSINRYHDYTYGAKPVYYQCTSLIVNVGKQFVMNNAMSIEWNVGIGLGISNDNNGAEFYHSNILIEEFPPFFLPLSFTAGFKIGILAY